MTSLARAPATTCAIWRMVSLSFLASSVTYLNVLWLAFDIGRLSGSGPSKS